jgi:single-stranded-DNA-specific exonuclease
MRVVPHTDADGLAAGALWIRARSGDPLLLGRGQTPFGDALPTGSSVVLDWGVRPLRGPALLVDHHAPEWRGAAGVRIVSGYGATPEISTAVLVRRLVGGPAWLAALGAVGDLGDAAWLLPDCDRAAKTAVRKLVPLVNAPRRLPSGPVRDALDVLVESETPEHALRDPRAALLDEARREWRSGFDRVVRTPPRVTERAAVIRFSSPYQVHPLVAAAWARRLAPRVVVAANDGYLPGRVNFAVRGGSGDLRRLLRDALPDMGGEFAHGHDRATGGSVAAADFDRLVEALA